MQKGNIGVTSENIFPIIKKFLYSEHEIFLREIVSNAVDATQKLKALARRGKLEHEVPDSPIRVELNKDKGTLSVSDYGIGMTEDEVKKYINQIALSSAQDFLDKYENDANAIIGHFGLGFYSSFMVSKKLEIFTKSYKKDAKAIHWSCEGDPEYVIEDSDKEDVGTTVVMHLDSENDEFLEEARINELLNKFCKFLPVPIAFGKKKDWKDGKEVETDEDNIINNTNPLWSQKPADIEEDKYKEFYKELYPTVMDDPLFHIHLNVDYPFNLTGILYFPKIHNSIELQKNKIQLYCNQVFVTDSVEGIVPEFLTLLHGVIDSPDIPLNISRSFLQSDANVRKISGHITKKVADKLADIFKNDRKNFEDKWDDIKVFIEYGMITNEKFYEKAIDFTLFKNTEGKYFTIEDYKDLIKSNQTDKNEQLVYLYATNKDEQYTYIEAAKVKGYDVLLMEGHLDTHFLNHIEQKFEKTRFVRVDSDVVDKLIDQDTDLVSKIEPETQTRIQTVFEAQKPEDTNYIIQTEALKEDEMPILITQAEFMRRMKDMSEISGGMYGNLPDSYNLVVNTNHPLIGKIAEKMNNKLGKKIGEIEEKIQPLSTEKAELEKAHNDKKDEEIPQEEKDKLDALKKDEDSLAQKKNELLKKFGKDNRLVKQLVDLALLSNNMLKGESLNNFVKRSIDMIK